MKVFSNEFCSRFFPLTQDDMEHKFIELRQEGGIVNTYVAEFSRLIIFPPTLVAEERDSTRKIQQGLSLKYKST